MWARCVEEPVEGQVDNMLKVRAQHGADVEPSGVSALDRPAAELTVMDVYDIAAVLGHDLERIIDRFGCESLLGLVPKVVRVLELLEALVSRGPAGGGQQEAEELRRELERLRQERNDRYEQERKHQKELELVEDMWRGEAQDLLSQIAQLQAENKTLLVSLAETPVLEDNLQRHEGMSEREQQAMKRLTDLVEKQRDEIKAKDHELLLRNDDVEALQLQQHRLIRINQDLRHRIGVMEAQGKKLIQQRVELEASAQARQQELGALQMEVTRLKKQQREWELERVAAEMEESSLLRPGPARTAFSVPDRTDQFKSSSVWAECGGDAGFLANCFESDEPHSLLASPAGGELYGGETDGKAEGWATLSVATTEAPSLRSLQFALDQDEEDKEEGDEEPDRPRFTLEELRDVLQERNELKAQVFVLQEELAYYKSEEQEDDDDCPAGWAPPPSPCPALAEQPESGIKRLIFTAIMPMVAAGLIADDPTLLPIRRLVSFV